MAPVAPFVVAACLAATPATRTSTVGSAPETELGVLPAVNFNSDIGIGFGVVAVLAKVSPRADPYHWRLALQLFAAAKEDDAGNLGVPFQSHFLRADVPGLWGGKVRLNGQLAFARFSNAAYYGLGNRTEPASFTDEERETSEVARRFDRYDRLYPNVAVNLRYMLDERPRRLGRRRIEAFFGFDTTLNFIDVYRGSRLEQDLERRDGPPNDEQPLLQDLLQGTDDHVLMVINLGLLWDSRDHEFAPRRGVFAELSTRVSPGVEDDLAFAGFYFGASSYYPLLGPRLVLATRLAADLLVGNVPLYAMSLFGALNPTDGPGGTRSTRGVLLQRYLGKIKLLGNLELRGEVLEDSLLGQSFRLGLNAFFDAGRVWADFEGYRRDGQRIDGSFPELHTGVGGGLHFRWGESFVVRGQYAYSPSDDTTGLYIDLNHAF